jgi:pyruvate/2-oxoglutarate dehydrogenase complex dihydrolipoamide acyltransferase (E2) component
MRKPIEMPKFGYDMESGKIAGWTVSEGDKVSRGDVIAEIETEKSTVEMEATASGTLVEIVRQAGDDEIPVGEVIGYIDDEA